MKMPWEISGQALVPTAPTARYVLVRGTKLRQYHGRKCIYCGHLMHVGPNSGGLFPTRDHLVPVCRGGPNHQRNIVICCSDCNHDKGPLDQDEYMAVLAGLASRLDRKPSDVKRSDWIGFGARKVYLLLAKYPYNHHAKIRRGYCNIMKATGA